MKRALILAAALVLLSVIPASAAPPGGSRDPGVGKKLDNFNLIAVPHTWTPKKDGSDCFNNGSRIFLDGNLTLNWDLIPNSSPDFNITDCNGTDGDASITVNEAIDFWVMIRVVGKAGSSLDVYCHEVIDVGSDDLCLVNDATVTYNKSNSFTKVMFNVFDNATENVSGLDLRKDELATPTRAMA
jgi:hypothetical protein